MFRLMVWFTDKQNQFWVSPTLSAVAATVVCAVVWILDGLIGPDVLPTVSTEALDGLLAIIASSMLAVATFSLGIIVSATASVASSATPRATELVMGDDGTRRAIGAFIGSFVYAVVAKTALSFELYGPGGQFLLTIATLAVLAYMVAELVLWVRTVSRLGRLNNTLSRLERQARQQLRNHVDQPWLGAGPADDQAMRGYPIYSVDAGFLTRLNMAALESLGDKMNATIQVGCRPGAFVDPADPIAYVDIEGSSHLRDTKAREQVITKVRSAFVIESSRGFDQDPRFGIIALGEVAQRALSPAVNDPGTAIQVASLLSAMLIDTSRWREEAKAAASAEPELLFEHVTVPGLSDGDFVADGFAPIARDGAGNLELAIRVQKLLAIVVANCDGDMRDEARRQAAIALERNRIAMSLDQDKQIIEQLHTRLHE